MEHFGNCCISSFDFRPFVTLYGLVNTSKILNTILNYNNVYS
jgi:hypothetical protein